MRLGSLLVGFYGLCDLGKLLLEWLATSLHNGALEML